MNMRRVTVYRSSREEGLYLYVDHAEDLARVPEELLKKMGKTEKALVLNLTPERKLARADTLKVLAAIDKQGFYLQLPPAHENLLP